jgi:hypothetical protein
MSAEQLRRKEVAAWAGSDAANLGLTTDVDPEHFEALSELATDKDGPGRREPLRGEDR